MTILKATRAEVPNPDGTWTITVTPPPWTGIPASPSMVLSASQHADYQRWREGDGLIQDLMPYLTDSQREYLMTGISDEEWEKMWGRGPSAPKESD